MGLAENLIDLIFDLDEQAFKRKKTRAGVDNLASQITRHIFLVTHFPQNQAYNHWMHELNNWSDQLADLNQGKKNKQNLDAVHIKNIIRPYYKTTGDQELKKKFAVKKGLIQSADEVEFDLPKFDAAIDKFVKSIVDVEVFKL